MEPDSTPTNMQVKNENIGIMDSYGGLPVFLWRRILSLYADKRAVLQFRGVSTYARDCVTKQVRLQFVSFHNDIAKCGSQLFDHICIDIPGQLSVWNALNTHWPALLYQLEHQQQALPLPSESSRSLSAVSSTTATVLHVYSMLGQHLLDIPRSNVPNDNDQAQQTNVPILPVDWSEQLDAQLTLDDNMSESSSEMHRLLHDPNTICVGYVDVVANLLHTFPREEKNLRRLHLEVHNGDGNRVIFTSIWSHLRIRDIVDLFIDERENADTSPLRCIKKYDRITFFDWQGHDLSVDSYIPVYDITSIDEKQCLDYKWPADDNEPRITNPICIFSVRAFEYKPHSEYATEQFKKMIQILKDCGAKFSKPVIVTRITQ